jgi:hypothetical protein
MRWRMLERGGDQPALHNLTESIRQTRADRMFLFSKLLSAITQPMFHATPGKTPSMWPSYLAPAASSSGCW